MIRAVIFDMDGLLIDSEPFWRESEIKVFSQKGIFLTEDDCRGTTGMRLDEVVEHWGLKFPKANLDYKSTEIEIMDEVCARVEEKGEALPGVRVVIDFFESLNLPLAVASASSYRLINQVLKKLNIENRFKVIQSAEFMSYGKPHPEVFLEAANKLKVRVEECLVLEDSVLGIIAAKAARMKAVAVPDAVNFNKKGYCIADEKLNSLTEFNAAIWLALNQ